jgi:hypothetical protein
VLLLTSSLLAAHVAKETAPIPERVPFPKDYQSNFQEIRASNKTAQTLLGTIYVNAPAASIKELDKLPYPDGSIFVMEWAEPVKGANGELLVDANGNWKKGPVVRVDVMRREKGFGVGYGEKRAGEWEFASYRPDGSFMSAPQSWSSCAECHTKAATRDFVFRGRFPAIEGK